MSPTDFILAFLSIVLALALQELLQGFGRVVRARKVRELPLAHWLFAGGLIPVMVNFWWSAWLWREVATWTIAQLVVILLSLILLYLQCFLMFPPEGADRYGDYYLDSAGILWTLVVATGLASVVAVRTIYDMRYSPATLIPVLSILVLGLIGARSKSKWVHAVICGLLFVSSLSALLGLEPLRER